MRLEGKLAIVTGGGAGIGRGIVESFLDAGAAVAVIQRRELDAALRSRPGVVEVRADLTDVAAIGEAVERAVAALGGVDILVNNAGMMFERSVSDITVEEWDLMVALNLRAPLFLTRSILPSMRERGGGSIINIGSVEGAGANPGHAAYSATKAGIEGMTRALAVDLGRDGIRCNAIAPGWIATDLSEEYLDAMPDPAAARASLSELHPIGRVGAAADVGDLAVYLAGDQAGFITGETIVIDGGRTIKLSLPR